MSDEKTAEVVRRLYRAHAAMDVPTINALLGPDPVMHVPGNHPLSGEHRGKDAIWAYLGKVAEISSGTGGFEVHTVTTDDAGHGVALLTGTIRDFVRPVIHVWHVREGLLTEYWEANLDQRAEDAFWTTALDPSQRSDSHDAAPRRVTKRSTPRASDAGPGD